MSQKPNEKTEKKKQLKTVGFSEIGMGLESDFELDKVADSFTLNKPFVITHIRLGKGLYGQYAVITVNDKEYFTGSDNTLANQCITSINDKGNLIEGLQDKLDKFKAKGFDGIKTKLVEKESKMGSYRAFA